ncbi:hypothetical protein Misp05_38610 [Micromonospora sp. NBRC 107095]|nr:hypothetical protein Misp05_38610 [Micromonospora sp. NBRC 107095]
MSAALFRGYVEGPARPGDRCSATVARTAGQTLTSHFGTSRRDAAAASPPLGQWVVQLRKLEPGKFQV